MNRNRHNISHVRFPGRDFDDDGPPREEGKLTEGVPLAKLIKRRFEERPELVMLGQPRSVAAERFRRLKTLLMNDDEGAPQVIVVTSASPSEGKSLVSTNLALAFASDMQGEVLLLDADLRRPTLEHWLSPPPKLGLSELLTGRTELDHVLLELKDSALRVIPAGEPPRDPVELLSSDSATALMEDLRRRFQRIIIDTPPIVPFTDADAIGGLADGVLIVARAEHTRKTMLTQAVDSVTSTRVLGTVLNDVTYSLADREHYYGTQYYHDYYSKDRRK